VRNCGNDETLEDDSDMRGVIVHFLKLIRSADLSLVNPKNASAKAFSLI
jgi:hypothetical protein